MSTTWAFVAVLVATTPAEPLPDHIDIPDGYSTVICPDQQAAKTMLDRHYGVKPAPHNHIEDTDLFFAGLKATGCVQDSAARKGTVTIKAVQQRKILGLANGSDRIIRYSGVNATGQAVVGIVNEDGNNGYPRTPLAEWLSGHTQDGWLDARSEQQQGRIFFRCDSPAKANAVLAATKGMTNAKPAAFTQKLAGAAAQHGCRKASDRYFPTALLEKSSNSCGDECFIDLTALAATDRSGVQIGLIFDGSLM